jgi:hypothetical protein
VEVAFCRVECVGAAAVGDEDANLAAGFGLGGAHGGEDLGLVELRYELFVFHG